MEKEFETFEMNQEAKLYNLRHRNLAVQKKIGEIFM